MIDIVQGLIMNVLDQFDTEVPDNLFGEIGVYVGHEPHVRVWTTYHG